MTALGLSLVPLGERVRARRLELGLTRDRLALRSGLSLRFLADLELGRGNISIARLMEVARALECPVAELVSVLDAKPAARAPLVSLVGLRGAGKSTVGARAAERLGVPFVELDQEIERAAGAPLGQLFELYGEAYYRRLEREVLAQVLDRHEARGAVLATGGGLVTDPETWGILRGRTHVVWLRARPEDHYRRVAAQGDLRPMANRPGAREELEQILRRRAPLYAEARTQIDTSELKVQAAVRALCRALGHSDRSAKVRAGPPSKRV